MSIAMSRVSLLKVGVVVIATLFSLLFAEFVVRMTTVYPNTLASNRVYDEDVGFHASSKIPEIDEKGYRNPPGTGHEIIAVGDSQTFGNNVRADGAWPAVLGRMIDKQVYNYGLGGYGLLSYHAILKRRRDPDTKSAIVALYPANDFELFYASDADCLILDHPNAFWKAEREKLDLEWPAYPVGCLHNDYDAQSGLYDRLKDRIALLALFHDGFVNIAEFFGRQQPGHRAVDRQFANGAGHAVYRR